MEKGKILPNVKFSCVIDEDPFFARQAAAFVCTLVRNVGAAPRDIVIHYTTKVSKCVSAAFDAAGVNTVRIDSFSTVNPYLNKLRQLETKQLADSDLVVLCDCDIAFVSDMRNDLRLGQAAAAIVDRPKPPAALWNDILLLAGLNRSRPDVKVRCGQEMTLFENRNGGFYAMPGAWLAAFAGPWGHWAKWLIAHSNMLGWHARNIDQIAFALACLSENIEVDLLSADCNVPTHLEPKMLPPVAASVLHYHRHTDATGLLLPVGVPIIDDAIRIANDAIEVERETRFPDPLLWRTERWKPLRRRSRWS